MYYSKTRRHMINYILSLIINLQIVMLFYPFLKKRLQAQCLDEMGVFLNPEARF